MYTKQIPFKDYQGKPRNQAVNFQLEPHDVVKNIVELQALVQWYESMTEGETRELSSDEVKEFYTNFEAVLLNAWGVPSEDGLYFRRAGRYDFEESKLFAATMSHFLSNPEDMAKFLDDVMPKEMAEMIKTTSENAQKAVDAETDPARKSELQALQARIAELETGAKSVTA